MHDTGDAAVSTSGPQPDRLTTAADADAPAIRRGISVLVVSSIRLFREGLAQALRHQPTIGAVETAAGQVDAVALIHARQRDVVVVDVATAGEVDTIRALREVAPTLCIIAFGVADANDDVLACAQRGVAGYVTRDGTLADMVTAIEDASRGELHCSPGLAAAMFKRLGAIASGSGVEHDVSRLTPREREVLGWLRRGFSNKAIAWRLGIEQATVKNHVHNVLEKLKLHRRSEVAVRADLSRVDAPPARH